MIRLIYKDHRKKKQFEKFGSLYSRCISCEENEREPCYNISRLTSIQFNSENPWGEIKNVLSLARVP